MGTQARLACLLVGLLLMTVPLALASPPTGGETSNVDQNETWTEDATMDGHVVVASGSTLTVNANITMETGSSITVEEGGQLVVTNGALLSDDLNAGLMVNSMFAELTLNFGDIADEGIVQLKFDHEIPEDAKMNVTYGETVFNASGTDMVQFDVPLNGTDLVLNFDSYYFTPTYVLWAKAIHSGGDSATLMAQEIRAAIWDATGLTASAGISINKFLAKIGSDWNKPNGQKTIPPEEVIPFLEALDIKKFYGVGKKTAERMYQKGIFTGADLKQRSREALIADFGKSGGYYYDVVRGIHNAPVQSTRIAKSIGAERTFDTNLSSELFLEEKLLGVTDALMQRLARHKRPGKTITLKLKYSDFTIQTRSKTLDYYVSEKSIIYDIAKELLYQERLKDSVRLIGITLSNFKGAQQADAAPAVAAQLKIPF